MIFKGAIDNIHSEKVGGWIYSDTETVRGTEVQAFVGTDCVGAGRVEIFRQDLLDAGLGDGYLGFSFPISLRTALDRGRVTIKMSESDFFLLPARANVSTPSRFDKYCSQPYTDSSIEFMRKKGWLSSSELNFAKFVRELGVFDVSLVRPKVEQRSDLGHLFQPDIVATGYFSLMSLAEVAVNEFELQQPSAEDIVASIERSAPKPFPLIGLLASSQCYIELVEGSHKDETKPQSLMGAVQHLLGPDRMLFINPLCAFSFNYENVQTSVRVFHF